MKCYFVANIKITDKEEYDKYIDKVDLVFSEFKGEYLAVDDTPTILEGNRKYDRQVIIQFPSKREFENWYHSADYQEILKHRLKGAICDTILVEGK